MSTSAPYIVGAPLGEEQACLEQAMLTDAVSGQVEDDDTTHNEED